MTLGTHAITGAAVASLTPTHPVLGFCAGFASHFLADALPHYDYPIYSESIHPQKREQHMKVDAAFVRDALDFSIDAGAGIVVSLIAFAYPPTNGVLVTTILAGAVGGIIPDPLQFVSKKIPYEPLLSLQRFHKWMHAKWRLRDTGHVWTGIISQLAFIVVVIAVAKLL